MKRSVNYAAIDGVSDRLEGFRPVPVRGTSIASALLVLAVALALSVHTGGPSGSAQPSPQPLPAQSAPQSIEAGSATPSPASIPPAVTHRIQNAYGKLPLSFVPNDGQVDKQVRYYAQGTGFSFYFTKRMAVLVLAKGKRRQVLNLRFLGANQDPKLLAKRPGPGTVSFLRGSDRSKWRRGIGTFGELTYRDLWPGIDMVFSGRGGRLTYDFHVHPGARVSDIRLAYQGAEGLSVSKAGDLLIKTPLGVLSDQRPRSFERIGPRKVALSSRFVPRGSAAGSVFGLEVEGYQSRRSLVIDPAIDYSTYVGGATSNDYGQGIAVDAAGSAYVTGYTSSTDFPTTAGAFQQSRHGGFDAFVTKLNPAGSGLAYSTYLGGSSTDLGKGIAVDGAGNAYVTGQSCSSDFPTTPGAFQTSLRGCDNAFVVKLNAAGSALTYSTYLGGSADTAGQGIAVEAGTAYVTGYTCSGDFPTTADAFQTSLAGCYNAFVTRLNAAGSALVYSTYLGGSNSDFGNKIAVDAARRAYVTGNSCSTDFPTTLGAFQTSLRSCYNAFVTKLNVTGSGLVYSTYLGGSGSDNPQGIAFDGAGSAYVTGSTSSADFPTTVGAFQPSRPGGFDAFVTKLNATGSALAYSTYLGGTSDDVGRGIAVDGAGSAYVTGNSCSTNFPTTPGAFQTSLRSCSDAFVTKLNVGGSGLAYSTYLGGSAVDVGQGIAVDHAGSVYVTGYAGSANFPTTAGAFQTGLSGLSDAFVTKLGQTLSLAPKTATDAAGTAHCVTATLTALNNPNPNKTIVFTVTGANPAGPSSLTTDASGQAQFCYTGQNAGADTITAFADLNSDNTHDPGEPTDTAASTYTPATPTQLALAPQSATDPAGTQHCVTATVRDAYDNPNPNVAVRFTVTGANPAGPSSLTTDASGQAQFCYTGQNAGADTITAFADLNSDNTHDPGEPTDTAASTYTPATPTQLALAPQSATDPAGTQHCVTATVRDAYDNPNPNVAVRFTVTGANPAGPSSLTTDASGQAQFCYTGQNAGADTITAFADLNSDNTHDPGEPTDTAASTYTPATPTQLALAPQSATDPAGTQHCVTATVRDAYDNPNPNVAVRFTVTGANPAGPSSLTTDASGQAQFCYTGQNAGADTITAFADLNSDNTHDPGEPTDTAASTYTPATPTQLALAPQSATDPAGTQHCVTATVRDAYDNPNPNVAVRFTVTGANPAGPSSLTTDASGQAQFCYTGQNAGADTITAFADLNSDNTHDPGEPTDTAASTYTPATPTQLALAPQSATDPAGTQHCVTATVRDAYDNPNPNVAVRFTVTGANPAGPSSLTTDASGQAQFCYTGQNAGADTITAFADLNSDNTREAGEPKDTASETYVNYPRPRGASPLRTALVIAYQACASSGANRAHGAPLSHPSCKPPVQSSNFLTVGTPDANGAAPNAAGFVQFTVRSDASDVRIDSSTSDVRCKSAASTSCGSTNAAAGPDYSGQLRMNGNLRITDTLNGPGPTTQGTVTDAGFPVTLPCAETTSKTTGSTCSVSTTANAVAPGSVQAGHRAVWELGQVSIFDGGTSGVAGASDATLFEDQGIFVP